MQALCVTARSMRAGASSASLANGGSLVPHEPGDTVDDEFLAQLELAVRGGVYGAPTAAQPTVATMQL